jgi:CheY-like chemotaxis protein
MGILHSSYIHPGTHCTVYIPLPNGTEMGIEGSVMRCKHFKGLIHEVGIKFKIAINVREFLDIDPMEGRFTLESVDASRLNGSVLHVDDSAMDRRLVRHFLKDTGLNVITVENGAEALARSKEQFDAILLDSDLPDTSGPALAEQLRNAGLQTPIILVTADTRQTTREAARAARVNAIVTKPVSQEKLFQAIAEFLLLDGSAAEGAGAIFTTLKADDPTYAFVSEFIEEVRGLVTLLNKALQAEDVASLRRLCFQIKGAAPALGFAPLGHAAELAMQSLDATMSAQESIKPLRALLSICLRVKERDNPRAAA